MASANSVLHLWQIIRSPEIREMLFEYLKVVMQLHSTRRIVWKIIESIT